MGGEDVATDGIFLSPKTYLLRVGIKDAQMRSITGTQSMGGRSFDELGRPFGARQSAILAAAADYSSGKTSLIRSVRR